MIGATELGAEAHINACFKHFYFFTHEFNLVDDQEYEPLVRQRALASPHRTDGRRLTWLLGLGRGHASR